MGLGKFTATRLSVCSKIRCTDNRFASVFGSSNVVTLSRDLTRQLRTDCAFDVLRQLVNSFGIWAFNPLEHSLELNAGVAERQRLPPSCKSTGTPPLRSRSRSGGRHRAFLFYRHPASVPCASFSASCRKRRSAHDARSPLGRCGAVCVRKASLRLPCARSLRPGERGVGLDGSASRLPCRVRRVASCHRALSCGDIHVAACSVITPGWRHRAEDCDDILSSLRSPRFTTEATHGRHPAEEHGGHPAHQWKRPPCGGLVKRRFTPVQMLVYSSKRPDPFDGVQRGVTV